VRIGDEDSVASVVGARVSVEFFATLGVRPLLAGHCFRPIRGGCRACGGHRPARFFLWADPLQEVGDALGQR